VYGNGDVPSLKRSAPRRWWTWFKMVKVIKLVALSFAAVSSVAVPPAIVILCLLKRMVIGGRLACVGRWSDISR
jgi:hypothetical protein